MTYVPYDRLNPEEKEFFEKWYAQMKAPAFQRAFFKRFNKKIPISRLKSFAHRHKLNEVPPNYYKLSEMIELVPYTRQALIHKIKKKELKARTSGKEFLIPAKDAVRLIESIESALPWPAIQVTEAAKKLGYHASPSYSGGRTGLTDAIDRHRERFPVVKFKSCLWMPQSLFDLIERCMRESGSHRVDWLFILSEYEKLQASE